MAIERPVTRSLTALVDVGADAAVLPTEFQIFAPGKNPSTKGTTLFDAKAAASVMAAYRQHGCDLMIDLEHQSLEAGAHTRADAADARGWFQLELRSDGSLWAVNVRWTPDGEQRLRERRQRYISPTFYRDVIRKGLERPKRLLNLALCAMPATDAIEPLVAASEISSQAAATRKQAIAMLALACLTMTRQTIASPHKAYRSTGQSHGSRTDQKGARTTRGR